RHIVLDSRFRGNDVMPALRLRSGQAPAGIQCSLSLGSPLRTLLRQRANYTQSSPYICPRRLRKTRGEVFTTHTLRSELSCGFEFGFNLLVVQIDSVEAIRAKLVEKLYPSDPS